jgi:hypothetical protein
MSFSKVSLRSTIAAAFFAVAFAARAALDLTPEVSEYTAEGTKFQQLSFHEDKQRIEYEPPQGWSFDGGAAEIRLKPPKKNFAEATISTSSLNKPQPLDENVRAALKEKFLASVPAGSQFVKLEQEIESPIRLNDSPTLEIIVSYQLMGEKFFRSALFANVRDNQMTFRCSARKDDFERVHQEFRSSLLSWHWVEPAQQAAQPASPTE